MTSLQNKKFNLQITQVYYNLCVLLRMKSTVLLLNSLDCGTLLISYFITKYYSWVIDLCVSVPASLLTVCNLFSDSPLIFKYSLGFLRGLFVGFYRVYLTCEKSIAAVVLRLFDCVMLRKPPFLNIISQFLQAVVNFNNFTKTVKKVVRPGGFWYHPNPPPPRAKRLHNFKTVQAVTTKLVKIIKYL